MESLRARGLSSRNLSSPHKPFAVCRLPFAVCRLPFAVCRLPFANSLIYRLLCEKNAKPTERSGDWQALESV
jgi:hypothetical protein